MTAPTSEGPRARATLQRIARRAMIERGLAPDFEPGALAQLKGIAGPAAGSPPAVVDLRDRLWCSIDNDDSRDLDQLSCAEELPGGETRILVAIADVTELVGLGSPLDQHAGHNTTSVYTAGQIFPMLPERLSTDLTSLGLDTDRLAVVVDMLIGPDGVVRETAFHQAIVRNRAKLAYPSVGGWLEGTGPMPEPIGLVPGLEENLRLQDTVARRLRGIRHSRGALSLETIEARPVFEGDSLADLEVDETNKATQLIEDLMIAANSATARFLASRRFPSLRRIVRTPKHWDLIVALAAKMKSVLPAEPDAGALERFLVAARAADPVRFPDLSLSVIKLMGSGEYVMETAAGETPGHFGLAVRDYTHSTAPNRRYPDVISQRLLKAAHAGRPPPYSVEELEGLARHCTEQENAAKKVERSVAKAAAAMLLEPRLGEVFEALVTGAAEKGTWVRILSPPIEGRLVGGFAGRRVGNRLRVRLVHTDVERGFIDFASVE